MTFFFNMMNRSKKLKKYKKYIDRFALLTAAALLIKQRIQEKE